MNSSAGNLPAGGGGVSRAPERSDAMKPKPNFSIALALGAGIGAALGVAMHNLPVGVALGGALGVALGLGRRRSGASH